MWKITDGHRKDALHGTLGAIDRGIEKETSLAAWQTVSLHVSTFVRKTPFSSERYAVSLTPTPWISSNPMAFLNKKHAYMTWDMGGV